MYYADNAIGWWHSYQRTVRWYGKRTTTAQWSTSIWFNVGLQKPYNLFSLRVSLDVSLRPFVGWPYMITPCIGSLPIIRIRIMDSVTTRCICISSLHQVKYKPLLTFCVFSEAYFFCFLIVPLPLGVVSISELKFPFLHRYTDSLSDSLDGDQHCWTIGGTVFVASVALIVRAFIQCCHLFA